MLQRTERLPRKNPPNKYFSKFIFAVGGHSAAAGHGDFHEESYGRVLERSVKSTFASIRVDFITRQYAMGSMDSACEVAICVDSIFGIDIDALSWDFGMTDGREQWKMLLYAYHAGMQDPFIHDNNNHDNHLLDHIVSPVSFFAFNVGRNFPTVKSIGLENCSPHTSVTYSSINLNNNSSINSRTTINTNSIMNLVTTTDNKTKALNTATPITKLIILSLVTTLKVVRAVQ